MKTGKRELAVAMVFFLFLIGAAAIWLSSPTAITVLEIVIWPLMMFVFGAYGMDWITKQTDFAGSKVSVKNSRNSDGSSSSPKQFSVSD